MVLHNDKWKQKAKRAVERKHRQQGKQSGTTEVNGPTTNTANHGITTDNVEQEHDSDGNSNYNTDTDTEGEDEDDEGKKYRKSKKVSNSWRFADPVIDETILKDPEYQQQLEAARLADELERRDRLDVIIDKLKDVDVVDKDDLMFTGSKELKEKKRLQKEDFSSWKLEEDEDEDSDNGNANSKTRPEVREFTEAEKIKFLQMQKNIKHQRELEGMKARIGQANGTNSKGRVLEVHGNIGRENYRSAVDEKLGKVGRGTYDAVEHDRLVEEMLGVSFKDKDTTVQNEGFDIDELVKSKPTNLEKKNLKKKDVKLIELDNLDEDFLDSLL